MALPLLAAVGAVAIIWNLTTDWVWIGGSFGVLPENAKKDIAKRVMAIDELVSSGEKIIYAAKNAKRRPNSQEIALIKKNVDEARRQIVDMKQVFENKFVLFGAKELAEDLQRNLTNVELRLQSFEVVAGFRQAEKVVADTITRYVKIVYDGDTIETGSETSTMKTFSADKNYLLTGIQTKPETVRLVGIDAPESTTDAGVKSKMYLKKRIEGKQVRIESDPNALTDMYGRRLGVVYLDGVNINLEMIKLGYAKFYAFEPNALVYEKQWKAANTSTVSTPSVQPVKVFTGIVTQGKLGEPSAFVARETDLIDNMNEMISAAQNNLASFIVALPGRIVYEIKIVSSVTSRDGFVTRGTTQRIVSGYYKNGQPKYKTVTNKFAQLNVYFVTSKGIKSKIDTINLGPVNAATFVPTAQQLQIAEGQIKSSIITNDTKDFNTVVTNRPINVEQPIATQVLPVLTDQGGISTEALKITNKSKGEIYDEALKKRGYSKLYKQPTQWTMKTEAGVVREVLNGQKLVDYGYNYTSVPDDYNFGSNTSGGGIQADVVHTEVLRMLGEVAPTVTTGVPVDQFGLPQSNNPNRCAVSTIAEFFDVNKTNYPKLAERAKLYEEWGLGPAAYYVGTAEQNNKWLGELKKRSGC